jgi:hypothetical protein
VFQAIVGFVLGIALLMAGVVEKAIPVSVVGFVVMLGCAVLAVTSWRRIPPPGEAVNDHTADPRRHRPRARLVDRIEERWRRRRDDHDQP